jgi:hypothetical protein
MSGRHVQVLHELLDAGEMSLDDLVRRTRHLYAVKNPFKAFLRDLTYPLNLDAVRVAAQEGARLAVNLDWPTEITEPEFFRRVKAMPKGKVHGFLSR